MNDKDEKCVMIIDENLPVGIVANTAAILGITIGTKTPDIVGEDVPASEGGIHSGIVRFPVPILKGNADTIKALRLKLFADEFSDLTVVDFTQLAQKCKTYGEFTEKMSLSSENQLNYIGLAICGEKRKVNSLTGNLGLLK